MLHNEIIIIGGGIAGITAFHLLKNRTDAHITIFEPNRIGGLCVHNEKYADKALAENGYKFGEYGEHIFHTNIPEVAKLFKEIYPDAIAYEHRTEIYVNGRYLPYPPNKETMKYATVADMVNEYTSKQWGDTLSASDRANILKRFKVYDDNDTRTFRDRYQYVPNEMDYTKVKSLNEAHIVRCSADVNILKECSANSIIINTSPLDKFYGKDFLTYRSLYFEFGIDYGNNFKNRAMTINYPEKNYAYTRVHHHGKILSYEYPSATGIPMYPIINPTDSDRLILSQLPELQTVLLGHCCRCYVHHIGNQTVIHAGRLGSYQYLNIDLTMYGIMTMVEHLLSGKLP
jgi:UDP-galactopyranose mutase